MKAEEVYLKHDIVNKFVIFCQLFNIKITNWAFVNNRENPNRLVFYHHNFIVGVIDYDLNDCFCPFNLYFLPSLVGGYYDLATESFIYQVNNIEGVLTFKELEERKFSLSGRLTIKDQREELNTEFAILPMQYGNDLFTYGLCLLRGANDSIDLDDEEEIDHNILFKDDQEQKEIIALMKLKSGKNYTLHAPYKISKDSKIDLKIKNINFSLFLEDIKDKEPELVEFIKAIRKRAIITKTDGEVINLFDKMFNMCMENLINPVFLFSYRESLIRKNNNSLERRK